MFRLVRVMDEHLAENEWFAGERYTIADMSILPWVEDLVKQPTFKDRAHLIRWANALLARPTVVRGLDVERPNVRPEIVEGGMIGFDDEHRSELFGDNQHKRNKTKAQ